MKIKFSDVIVERKHLPKLFQNFKFFVENAFGLTYINLEIESLEFYFKEGENKTKFFDEESYQKIRLLEEEKKINEIYIEVKIPTTPPEEKPIIDDNYGDYLFRVFQEEFKILNDNLKFMLPDKNILKELPEFITVNKIQCNGCNSSIIVGPLYKCVICDNEYFCEHCIDNHNHPTLKIYQ